MRAMKKLLFLVIIISCNYQLKAGTWIADETTCRNDCNSRYNKQGTEEAHQKCIRSCKEIENALKFNS
ncbi:TPA: hypothetical protein DIC20_01390 [Candidatus Dependentiae bacterium]|nr:MAG: hypothetical protein US03_C0002G0115 [candidate division TM6 bacterium GW2011_GWF2_36_131]KKQ03548.1 MAG: hypothetical protein US13_C0002G0114 [candidate division TM6 bacterium GW2011_GWE2_36_25]KKQ20177.1 MAG: hypothetical protein US32_C0001G0074 [candidate division TM6 bacterium GW2011_GWA2_36_9]HBR70719.1 hypothetical protein [Candidatus Dependentiae bacterium]HCU00339.1 hypothetical protein [Candidatus Dependentiae bacterium]